MQRDPEDELCATCNCTWFAHTIVDLKAAGCQFKPSGTWPEPAATVSPDDVHAHERENPTEYDEDEHGLDI